MFSNALQAALADTSEERMIMEPKQKKAAQRCSEWSKALILQISVIHYCNEALHFNNLRVLSMIILILVLLRCPCRVELVNALSFRCSLFRFSLIYILRMQLDTESWPTGR